MRTVKTIEAQRPLFERRKRVAAYARVSMETERLNHSLSAQVSYYSKLIQSHPEWEYAGVYADSGQTGTTSDREQFQRLMAACEAGCVDIILTKSLSRFTRNTVDTLVAIRRLKSLGIDVRFEKEGISTLGENGELLLTLMALFSQEESRSISENAKWAIRKGFEKGQMRCGVLYGYRSKNGMLVIEPGEAAVVKDIFSWYLSGMSCYLISLRLAAQGTLSYRGRPFSHTVICQMIKNEKYTGNAILQKFFTESHLTHKLKRNRGEFPMYIAENTHPAIIDQETFDRVQTEIAKRHGEIDGVKRKAQWSPEQRETHRQKYIDRDTSPYLQEDLSLFIRCGECGKHYMTYQNKLADGSMRRFWRCVRHEGATHPIAINDENAKALICDVLGVETFDLALMNRELKEAVILGDTMTFLFRDGHQVERMIRKTYSSRVTKRG